MLLVKIERLHERTAACLAEGETLYDASGEVFGVITQIAQAPARFSLQSEGRAYSDTPQGSERVDLTVWITVEGRLSENLFLQNGRTALLVGGEILVYGNRTALCARILQVTTNIPQ